MVENKTISISILKYNNQLTVGPKSILVTGGKGNDGCQTSGRVEILSNEVSLTNKTFEETPKHNNAFPLLIVHDGILLLCGGYSNQHRCLKYENGWKEHSILNQHRTFSSAVTTANGTFIFGGGPGCIGQSFEFLPKKSNMWELGSTNIPVEFDGGCAVLVPEMNAILLIGGWQTEKRVLTLEIGTRDFKAMNVTLLNQRKNQECARLPDTNVIVITGGGVDDDNVLDTTEVFNLEDNTITLGSPMNTKRWKHGMAVITVDDEDRLAIFGGRDENGDYLDSVEILNPRSRKWEVKSDLKLKEPKEEFGYISLTNDFISNL